MKNKWFKGSKFKKAILIVCACLGTLLLAGCLGYSCFDADVGDIFGGDVTKAESAETDPTDTNSSDTSDVTSSDPDDSDEPISVVHFSIDSVLYTAEIGATWGDWCEGRTDFVAGSLKVTTADGTKHIEKFSGAVVTASDPILSASYKLIADSTEDSDIPSTIIFTIDGTSYTAEEGMTWGDWVESDYNTLGLKDSSTAITTQDESIWIEEVTPTVPNVDASTYIEANAAYKLVGEEPATITFTVDGITYYAEENMSWYDWCNSDYNTAGFTSDSDDEYSHGVYTADNTAKVCTYMGDAVMGETNIFADAEYQTIAVEDSSGATNLISFTIDGTSYTAGSNTTWKQWIDETSPTMINDSITYYLRYSDDGEIYYEDENGMGLTYFLTEDGDDFTHVTADQEIKATTYHAL